MSTITSVAKRTTRLRKPPTIKSESTSEQGLAMNNLHYMEIIKTEINDTLVTGINKPAKVVKRKRPTGNTPGTSKTPKPKKPKRKVESFATDEETVLLPAMRGRIERARREKMYVMSRKSLSDVEQEFEVTGSTGNLYTIHIGPRLSCACSDFRFRRRHCKHILMVLLKLFHLPPSSPIFQTLRPDDSILREVFSSRTLDPSAMIPEDLKTLINKKLHGETEQPDIKTQRRPLDSSDCPVCCDAFEEKALSDILACLVCGNNIHKACFDMWKSTRGSSVTCVYCRSPWEDTNNRKKKVKVNSNHEGFINFGQELGLSGIRDTTTYRDFPYQRYY